MYQALLTKNKGEKKNQPWTWKISKGDTDVQKKSCLHPWTKSELLQVGQPLLILI